MTTRLEELTAQLATDNNAYNPDLYLERAEEYLRLEFPDLACGDAYRAVLLADYVRDYLDSGELEEEEGEGDDDEEEEAEDETEEKEDDEDEDEDEDDEERIDAEEFLAATHAWTFIRTSDILSFTEESALTTLSNALRAAGCHAESVQYAKTGLSRFPESTELASLAALPVDSTGKARRFVYPWNHYEPDRFAKETLEYLNTKVVPASSDSIEVCVVELPLLGEDAEDRGTTKHLGVFATKDIAIGEQCLREESALTVVTDSANGGLCEYCGQRYKAEARATRPSLNKADRIANAAAAVAAEKFSKETFTCELCEDAEAEGIETAVPVWCSSRCKEEAMKRYHPAVCSRPTAPIHRAAISTEKSSSSLTTGSQPGGAVYALLMMKAFAMAIVQNTHPLELAETKYLYGVPPVEEGDLRIGWGYEENVRGAVTILEALGVDVFSGKHMRLDTDATLAWWDTWVVNTLIAKFRGVASGRLNSEGKTEAAAAHTLYSMVNHDCEPTVKWECGGIMEFWGVKDMKKGEELNSCYCDNRMPVKERREWMMGCLGGACMCKRCVREDLEERMKEVKI
jgi:hypothetical protein